jgi:uncharacterized protein (DUF1684 family)
MKNKKGLLVFLFIVPGIIWFMCENRYTEDQKNYINELKEYRADKDIEFRDSTYSPFNRKSKVEFHALKYYSIWFTDKTTNEESYGVGRYVDFELNMNSDFIYTVDFNYAYNPYCAYSSEYSCAIPTKEDYLDIAIEAGEKKFHK